MNSPFVMVIFGATGDLAKSKLIPALFAMFKKGQLGDKFFIVGFARRPLSREEFITSLSKSYNKTYKNDWEKFSQNLYYQKGKFEEEDGYLNLIKMLNQFDSELGACITRLFYLATPPDNYETILDYLSSTKLSEGCGQGSSKWTKIIVEKPFGKDLETARALDNKLAQIFEERQIFRVDHYLGKETVQNMLAFRFANSIFEPIWNNKFIDHVQITWGEKKGIATRGKFFDGVGMLRDVAQNHLLQLLTSVAMEQPTSFSKEGVRNARAAAIKAIRCIMPADTEKFVVRGQYKNYKKEKDVTRTSDTETFVAMKVFVDTPRFANVPFYLRAGKKMPKDSVSISVVFTQTCHILFREYGCPEIGNVLTFQIQPNEGIYLRIIAKKPGVKLNLQTADMQFSYKKFGIEVIASYEKILLDIMSGDQMLFNRSDELESSWEFITNILEGWQKKESRIINYESGTWGPKEANELIEKDGRKWL